MADTALIAQAQARKQIEEGQALIEQVQAKTHSLVDEFARGEISREQFQKIYEHYQRQVTMAATMVAEADGSMLSELTPGETIAIRKHLTAKAKAMAIYYHATGTMLESVGDLNIPNSALTPTLRNFRALMQRGVEVEPRSQLMEGQWVLFVPGKYSTAVMMFSNEPAAQQMGIIQNMHNDFEAANDAALKSGQADGRKLAYTFLSIVKRNVSAT
jgi:hypothetical protein